MPEWPIGAVSKTVVALVVTVGSNPTLSARKARRKAGFFKCHRGPHREVIFESHPYGVLRNPLRQESGLYYLKRRVFKIMAAH